MVLSSHVAMFVNFFHLPTLNKYFLAALCPRRKSNCGQILSSYWQVNLCIERNLFEHSSSVMFAIENRLFERVNLLDILIEMKLVKL